jgi:hypothetical protein
LSSFLVNGSQIAYGVPLREVVPSGQWGEFEHMFGAAPAVQLFVAPGSRSQQPALPTADRCRWVTYTRSVLSWDIRFAGREGASLTVWLGSCSGVPVPAIRMYEWNSFLLQGEEVLNTASGIELPADYFALFQITTGHQAGTSFCYGTIALKGV